LLIMVPWTDVIGSSDSQRILAREGVRRDRPADRS
jgi:hypothetical protein